MNPIIIYTSSLPLQISGLLQEKYEHGNEGGRSAADDESRPPPVAEDVGRSQVVAQGEGQPVPKVDAPREDSVGLAPRLDGKDLRNQGPARRSHRRLTERKNVIGHKNELILDFFIWNLSKIPMRTED